MTLYAEIVLPLPIDQSFLYIVPQEYKEKIKAGSRALVPFHKRQLTGFVVGLRKRLSRNIELKKIIKVLDEEPAFTQSFLCFTEKLSKYYYSSWGELLKASLPSSFVINGKKKIILSDKGRDFINNPALNLEERRILTFLQKRSYSVGFLKRKFDSQNFPILILRLEKKGLIVVQNDVKKIVRRKEKISEKVKKQLEIDFSLDDDSYKTANFVGMKMEEKIFFPFLLYGPTDKREAVYFYLIRKSLELGKRILILVPEIYLTKAFYKKLEERLSQKASLLHSRLTERNREREWRRIKEKKVDVVVGPRSALLSPIENIGLIIVDEEQDESYYQKESPSYDARKGAWLRAQQENSIVIYGSAIPSVESFYNAKKGGYLLSLETQLEKRNVQILEHRLKNGIISAKLRNKIEVRVKNKEPVLIFFNRRGYASYLMCSNCSFIPRCKNCDIALTYHKREKKLICHYCNYNIPKIEYCPRCGGRIITNIGIGIEAVEEELKRFFPDYKVVCFDKDVTKGKEEKERVLFQFRKGKIDILVGTQLLVHQHELPDTSFVAILHPETILGFSEYRASEKTLQGLNQMSQFVSSENNAELFIQTALPDHHSIGHAGSGNYNYFFNEEIKYRKIMNYPPFSHMVEVLFQGDKLRYLARESRKFSSLIRTHSRNIEVLGPTLAPISKLRKKSRIQIILKSKRKKHLDNVLRNSLKDIRLKKSIIVYY